VSGPIETEIKFLLPEEFTEEDITQALESIGFVIRWRSTEKQIDTYFDTTGLTLLRSGVSLRLRRIGRTRVCTLKLPISQKESVMRRHEIQWEIPDIEAEQDELQVIRHSPDGANDAFSKLGVKSVTPVLRVLTFRHRGEAASSNGLLVDVVVDRTTFTSTRGQAKQSELELELRVGDNGGMEELARTLREHLKLAPSERSKFTVGMELVG
jgi:inorganic triphosphatase YgiF